MDIALARTFLAVVESGSFIAAAGRVNVSQSTVSTRIQTLEEQLGKTLFERSKAGAFLTPAGVRFQRHAQALVHVWELARLEVSLPEGFETSLAVGGQYSLWDGFLINWLAWMHRTAPQVALRTQMGNSELLLPRLVDGTIDIGVMYTPAGRPGFHVEHLFSQELVLVSSEAQPSRPPGRNYVYIDWGPEFRADHVLNFPDLKTPGVYMELGSLGLNYLLANPGTGYLPLRLVRPHLADGRLNLVDDVPGFSYPVYAVYPTERDPDLLETCLKGLRSIAKEQ